MKKNLRNILVLAMGLMTTVSFAQDWNVDSRTRIDMSGDNSLNTADQRATMGATWGGSDWGIHVSSDVNYTIGGGEDVSMSIYEAHASTDLFGMASMTIGRQALSYGSGALMSTNDWGANRTTWDGMSFGLGLSDMADITVGYHSSNTGLTAETPNEGNMHVNIAGEFSGWNVNVLYMTDEGTDDAATGIDISGGLMGASLNASMNTDFEGDEMRVLGLSYSVNDDMSVNISQTAYGDASSEGAGFNMAGTNMDGSWATTGGMGYLSANDEDLSYGLSYNMGSISLGATMHKITNTTDEAYERDVTEINLGYSLGDNAALGVRYATDGDDKYTWVTLTVAP